MEHYEAWKDEEPIWGKSEMCLPKKCEISFWAFVLFNNFFIFSDKQKSNSKNFGDVGFCGRY